MVHVTLLFARVVEQCSHRLCICAHINSMHEVDVTAGDGVQTAYSNTYVLLHVTACGITALHVFPCFNNKDSPVYWMCKLGACVLESWAVGVGGRCER